MFFFNTIRKKVWSSPHVLLTLTTLMWAGHANILKLSIYEVSPMILMGFRWIGCFLILTFFLRKEILFYIPKVINRLSWFWLMGGFGMAGFTICLIFAAQQTSAINLGITQSFIPALVMLLGLVILKTKITLLQALGLLLSLTGALILVSRGSFGTFNNLNFNNGDLIMLLGCLCYAGYTVGLTNRVKMPPSVMFAIFSFFAALTLIACIILEYFQGKTVLPSLVGMGLIAYCIIFPSILAQIFFIRGVELIGANQAGLYVNLVPVFTALIAVFILSETIYLYHTVSLVLVLGGIYITEKITLVPNNKKL